MTDYWKMLAAVQAGETPTLVFADWLDEHGSHEQADCIRTLGFDAYMLAYTDIIGWSYRQSYMRTHSDEESDPESPESSPSDLGSIVVEPGAPL